MHSFTSVQNEDKVSEKCCCILYLLLASVKGGTKIAAMEDLSQIIFEMLLPVGIDLLIQE